MQTTEGFIKAIKGLGSTPDAQSFSELLNIVPEERIFELAELLVDFTQKHDCLLEFISHVVALEVSQTKQELVLFREDCFAVKVINRILFSDLGKKYLTKLVTPMIKPILSTKDTIDISPELLKSDFKAFNKNLDLTLSYLDQFLTLFSKSPQFCPLLFREIFSIIQQHVDTKFGTNNSPYVLDFIFFKFICPAIISPAKYELVSDDNEINISTQRSLINVSKVLNNLAHNITEKYEDDKEYEKLLAFIKSNHPVLLSSLNRLVDPADIEKTKHILTASMSDTLFSNEELAETEEHLRSFLDAILKARSPAQSFSLSEQADLKDRKYAELMRKVESIDWKKKSSLKKSTLYLGKMADSGLICTLVESTFNVPIKTVFDFFCNVENHTLLYGSMLADPITVVKKEGNYKAYTVGFKFPFPLSPRINAFSQWEIFQSDKKACVVIDQMNDANYGFKKGYIRGQLYTSGWILEAESANVTKFKGIWHGHPKGSIPTWLVNSMNGHVLNSVENIRNHLEKKK